MFYSINYDLKQPGRDYSGLYKAIKSCGESLHPLGSTWLVDSNLDADAIWDRISPHVDENDFALVIGVTNDYQGWLPEDAWEWIKSRSFRTAA